MTEVAPTVIAGLLVAGIIGVVVMYRQVGELQATVARLSETVSSLAETVGVLIDASLVLKATVANMDRE